MHVFWIVTLSDTLSQHMPCFVVEKCGTNYWLEDTSLNVI